MNPTNEQRQKLGGLIAEQRDLENQLNKIKNQITELTLELLGEPFTREPKPETKYDLKKINTETAIGKNGEYKKATSADNMNNSDFDALVKDLEAHDGKLSKDGMFIWKFSQAQQTTIGLKPSTR